MSNIFELIRSAGCPAPLGVIQVGASYGQEIDLFRENGLLKGVFIEPLDQPFKLLQSICKKNEGYIALQALCAESAGMIREFHIASNQGMSSSMLEPIKHLEIFQYVKFDQKINLTTTTVDNLIFNDSIVSEDIVATIDVLYMDVQGAEYLVLLGALRTLKTINYIYMEHIRGELYGDCQPLLNYIILMDSLGFTINNVNYNSLQHADILFIRKSLASL